VTTGAVC